MLDLGKEEALRRVGAGERHLVRIAADVLTDESDGIGVTYSGFCQAALPHKRLPTDEAWVRRNEQITLMVEPGRLLRPGAAEPEMVGVPYGSRARLILLYLQTHAMRSGSREVELGRSMREWLQRMGIPHGGKSYVEVRDQAARLSTCKLTFYYAAAKGRTGFSNERIVDDGMLMLDDDGGDTRQGSLFIERVRLSESFHAALQKHPVPIWEPALRHIQNNSMALDLYVWLAYRLHVLQRPTPVRWAALHGQFGGGFKALRHFRPTFLANLRLALTTYPDARVEEEEDGLVLHPSHPPIRKLA
ncbi:replication protein RepA [Muricoccus radiodurans]|uniref:replication protein RepA n=1 Tax=Muricoccus radiodurans TaxID=2231721 RepID=UPI003CF49FD3